MLQNGPKCYRLNVSCSQHTHHHPYAQQSHLYIQCVLCRLCACYQIIAIPTSLIERERYENGVVESRWTTSESSMGKYYYCFFSRLKTGHIWNFSANAHNVPMLSLTGKNSKNPPSTAYFYQRIPKQFRLGSCKHRSISIIITFPLSPFLSLARPPHTSSFVGSHSKFACKCFMNTKNDCF